MKRLVIPLLLILSILLIFTSCGKGQDGADGIDGKDGQDGVGISTAEINEDGELVLFFTDGTSKNLGKITSDGNNKGETGVIINFATDLDASAIADCGKNVALQVAAMPVLYLNKESVPASVIEAEKEILVNQMKQDPKMANKPDAVLAKIVEGRIGKYYETNCLLEQAFVKDDSLSVAKYVASVAKELGGNIAVTGYTRFDKGEGIQKREEDFAAEIAKMVNG